MIQIKFIIEVILLLMCVVPGSGHRVLTTVLNVHGNFLGWMRSFPKLKLNELSVVDLYTL